MPSNPGKEMGDGEVVLSDAYRFVDEIHRWTPEKLERANRLASRLASNAGVEMSEPELVVAPEPVSDAARRAALAREIEAWVREGYRVETQMDYQAVVLKGHRTNHVLHVILSVITLGLWLLIWLLVAVFGGERRRLLVVDEFGKIDVRTV